jgi:peptidoglycan/LPS O-acetylase OafA/YrhL
VYWLGVALYASPIPADVHWLAGGAALLLLAGFLWRRSELVNQWLVRGTLYLAVITAVYLDHSTPQKVALLQAMKFVFLPLLALAVMVAVRLSKEKRFGATPLDLLSSCSCSVTPSSWSRRWARACARSCMRPACCFSR